MEKSKAIGEMQALLKKEAIIKRVAHLVLFSTLLLLLFLPCFQTEIVFKNDFSLYDEIRLVISSLSLDGSSFDDLMTLILAFLSFIVGLTGMVVDLVKVTLYDFDPEHYASLEYDKIKSMMEKRLEYDKIKSKTEKSKAIKPTEGISHFVPQCYFLLAIVFEISGIFFLRDSGPADATISDYFRYTNGVAWGFWVVLVFLIVNIALVVSLALNRKKLKDLVMKEDDEKKDTMSEQAEN